jgi:hypothetical protein
MRSITLLLTLAVGFAGTSPQTSQQNRWTRNDVTTESRFVLVRAVDDTGQPLLGLQPDDFVIENAGVRCDVLAAAPASYPLAFVVDTSDYARPDLQVIRTAIRRFVDGLEPRPIAIYSSGPPTSRVQDFTIDARRVSGGVAHLFAAPQSTTHTLEAVVSAARGLAREHRPVTGIVALSAGGLEMSPPTVGRAREALKASRSILYVVERQPLRLDRGIPQPGDGVFEALTQATHGQFIHGVSEAVYSGGLTAVRRELDGESILEYATTAASSHQLKLSLRRPGDVTYAIEIDGTR